MAYEFLSCASCKYSGPGGKECSSAPDLCRQCTIQSGGTHELYFDAYKKWKNICFQVNEGA